jgi:hypothetical protein
VGTPTQRNRHAAKRASGCFLNGLAGSAALPDPPLYSESTEASSALAARQHTTKYVRQMRRQRAEWGLLAHIDVVEAKREDWTRDPFNLIEEDGWFSTEFQQHELTSQGKAQRQL